MDATDVTAALLSAVLHAGWNAAVKASRDPPRAMTAQMLLSAVLVLPGLLWSGLPPLAAWPWIAGSTLMSVVTVSALLRGYELGGFGLVYPVTRAIAVVLVVPLVAVVRRRLAGARCPGRHCRDCAVAGLARLGDRARPRRAPAGIGLDLCRRRRCRGLHPLRRAGRARIGIAVGLRLRRLDHQCRGDVLAPAPQRRAVGAAAGQWLVAVPAAVASVASYLLILWVWGHAPIAPAAALRDTSAVFAILIAVVWLKEPFTRTRILAVLLAAAAVPLLRLG